MAMEDALKLALEFNVVGNALGQLKNLQSGIDAIGSSLSALASSEAFEKMQEGFKTVVEAAADVQSQIASIKGITNLPSEQLAKVQEHFEKMSESNPAEATNKALDGFRQLYPVLGNVAAAQQATDDAFKVSLATGMDYTQVIQMMTTLHENLGVSSTQVADVMGATARQFGITGEAGNRAAMFMSKISQPIKEMGGSLSEGMALLGEASKLAPGRGMQTIAGFIERMPTLESKLGVTNFKGGPLELLQMIQDRTAGLSDAMKRQFLSGLGVEGDEYDVLTKLLPVLGKVQAARVAIDKSGGTALAQEDAANVATFQSQLALLSNTWEALKVSFGTPLLTGLNRVLIQIKDVVESVRQWSEAHQVLTRYLEIGAGVFVGVIAALGMLGAAMTIGAGVIGAFSAAFAVVLGPIGLVIAGIAAVTGAGIYLYEHWGALNWSNLGKKIADGIIDAIVFIPREITKIFSAINWFNIGTAIVKGIADGLKAGVHLVAGGAHEVAHRIAGYFEGHSPPPFGPLHDINRIPITKTIAESLRPAPVVNAMQKVAMAAALVSVSLNGVAMPAAVRTGSAAPVINIGATTINIGGSNVSRDDFAKALDAHRVTLTGALMRELERRSRRQF